MDQPAERGGQDRFLDNPFDLADDIGSPDRALGVCDSLYAGRRGGKALLVSLTLAVGFN